MAVPLVAIAGDDQTREGLENLEAILDGLGVELRLSNRSQTILSVHVGDQLPDIAQDAKDDVVEAFEEGFRGMESVGQIDDPDQARVEIRRQLASILRKLIVKVIEENDLIDTGQLLSDVKHAPAVERG